MGGLVLGFHEVAVNMLPGPVVTGGLLTGAGGGLLPGWHPRLAMGRWPLLQAASVLSVWQLLPQARDPRGDKAETAVPLMRSLKVTRHHFCMSLMTQTNLITVGEERRVVESLGNILENWES